jgi:methionyl-tRNA synthetase
MSNKKTFYVTTPIYYTNASPHIGGAYTTIAADVIARWHKLLGKEVFFLTGTDEHGQKIQEIAEQNKQKPKEFVDKIAGEFKEAFRILNVSNDNFIRTTDPYHEEEVKDLIKVLYKKKLIYKGFYESYYCVGCEQYLTQSDLIEGCCPLHKRVPELKKEEAYLFKLSAFQDKLYNLIKSGKYCILPEVRRKEILTFIEGGLQDVSISRLKEKISWGIELPFDKKHTIWVWPDAFWNYISGLRQTGNKNFKKFWPANVQLMAKDILRVHATIWPALLLGAGYSLPKSIFVHGYFTIGGQKMSKSLGNVISPVYLVNKYGADSVRYYFMRNLSFGNDGDVSEEGLIERHNNELANKLGNLVSRVSALAETHGIKKTENKLIKKLKIKEIEKSFENYELDRVISQVFSFIDICNEYIQEKKPWESKDSKILYELADSIKSIAILLSPFIPETSEKISRVFNFNLDFSEIKKLLKETKIKKSEILFKKIEEEKTKQQAKDNKNINKSEKHDKIEGIIKMTEIDFSEWEKIDLRVGEIEKVEDIQGADKLYKLTINIGKENRTVCAGIKQHYSKDDLKGKKIILFTNLKPRLMRGIESQGMLLAAVSEDEKQVVLISPSEQIANGSKVR